jgi:hypothetical protein
MNSTTRVGRPRDHYESTTCTAEPRLAPVLTSGQREKAHAEDGSLRCGWQSDNGTLSCQWQWTGLRREVEPGAANVAA